METREALGIYKQVLTDKVERYLRRIKASDAVKSAELADNGTIHIEFSEPVDIEGQDVMNVFVRGGAIKKAKKEDEIEDQFFLISPIGEF